MEFIVAEMSGGGGCCGRQQMSPFQSEMDDVYDPEEEETKKPRSKKPSTPGRAVYSRQAAEVITEEKERDSQQEKSLAASYVPSEKDETQRKASFTVKEHEDCVKVLGPHTVQKWHLCVTPTKHGCEAFGCHMSPYSYL
jgi:hypothetical protein